MFLSCRISGPLCHLRRKKRRGFSSRICLVRKKKRKERRGGKEWLVCENGLRCLQDSSRASLDDSVWGGRGERNLCTCPRWKKKKGGRCRKSDVAAAIKKRGGRGERASRDHWK